MGINLNDAVCHARDQLFMGIKRISRHCFGCKENRQPVAILKQWNTMSPAIKGLGQGEKNGTIKMLILKNVYKSNNIENC